MTTTLMDKILCKFGYIRLKPPRHNSLSIDGEENWNQFGFKAGDVYPGTITLYDPKGDSYKKNVNIEVIHSESHSDFDSDIDELFIDSLKEDTNEKEKD